MHDKNKLQYDWRESGYCNKYWCFILLFNYYRLFKIIVTFCNIFQPKSAYDTVPEDDAVNVTLKSVKNSLESWITPPTNLQSTYILPWSEIRIKKSYFIVLGVMSII